MTQEEMLKLVDTLSQEEAMALARVCMDTLPFDLQEEVIMRFHGGEE